jgi:hypothetical protein
MIKSIVAIVVSYVVIFLLFFAVVAGLYVVLGVDRVFQPDSYEISNLWLALTVAGSFFAWMLGGWLCVWISKSLRTGQVFALVVFIGAAIGCLLSLNRESEGPHVRAGEVSFNEGLQRTVTPRWFHFVNPIVALAGALVGTRMKRRTAP